jgi:hypothetical protein
VTILAAFLTHIVLARAEPTGGANGLKYCNKGPVVIKVHVGAPECNGQIQCAVVGTKADGYQLQCWKSQMECGAVIEQHYTDYPECGGKEVKK